MIGGCNGERQQVAQRVDGDMDLRPLPALGSVIVGPCAALRRRLEGAAVETNRRRLALAPGRTTASHRSPEPRNKQRRSSAASADTPQPRGKIVRQKPPGAAATGYVPNPIEDLAKVVFALAAVLSTQQQIRQNKLPLLIRNVAWIRLPNLAHHSMLNTKTAPAKNLLRYKVHNRL